jgi:hypothetical protein
MNATNPFSILGQAAGSLRVAALGLALFLGGAGASSVVPALADDAGPATPAVSDSCDDATLGVDAEPWERSELFFGTAKPDGGAVGEAEWAAFLDREVTPRFPDGLTVLSGIGQWQGEDERIVQERSKLLIVFYPREFAAESGQAIEEIRAAYETAFQQQSVLRSDDATPVCVSF